MQLLNFLLRFSGPLDLAKDFLAFGFPGVALQKLLAKKIGIMIEAYNPRNVMMHRHDGHLTDLEHRPPMVVPESRVSQAKAQSA
jgi:hypothetical protein